MSKPVVLIVEDEAPLVMLLRYNLEKEGFQVCEAADGEEALVQIAERKPDVVLLDWMLPLVSGIEVCRRIRRAPGTRALPVVMLTARGADCGRPHPAAAQGVECRLCRRHRPDGPLGRLRDRPSWSLGSAAGGGSSAPGVQLRARRHSASVQSTTIRISRSVSRRRAVWA